MSVHLPNANDDRLRDMYDDMLRDHSGNVVPEELLPHEDGYGNHGNLGKIDRQVGSRQVGR